MMAEEKVVIENNEQEVKGSKVPKFWGVCSIVSAVATFASLIYTMIEIMEDSKDLGYIVGVWLTVAFLLLEIMTLLNMAIETSQLKKENGNNIDGE